VYYQYIRRSERYFDVIYSGVNDLGGIYIKLIQFLCLRTDIFPREHKARFLSFYDKAPFTPLDITTFLTREYGTKTNTYFQTIDQQPFASGSFGQVYKAKLISGEDVVIKVKRPRLERKLAVDFLILKIAVKIFNLLVYQRIINTNTLIHEFETLTYQELDYLQETQNATYFYNVYKNHHSVVIPKTYAQLCTKSVLVQEYVGGITLTSILYAKNENHGQDVDLWLRENYHTDLETVFCDLSYELGLQGFLHKRFYADPHPGNVKILPNNRYALIDFGILGNSPTNMRTYYTIFNQLVKNADEYDMERLSQAFLEWGAPYFYRTIEVLDEFLLHDKKSLRTIVQKKYAKELERKRETFRKVEIEETENFTKLCFEIISSGEKMNVKVPDGLLAVLRTSAIMKSLTECVDPNLRPMRAVYKKVLHTVDQKQLVDHDITHRQKISVEEALENVFDWTENIAESDPPFFTTLEKELKGVVHV